MTAVAPLRRTFAALFLAGQVLLSAHHHAESPRAPARGKERASRPVLAEDVCALCALAAAPCALLAGATLQGGPAQGDLPAPVVHGRPLAARERATPARGPPSAPRRSSAA